MYARGAVAQRVCACCVQPVRPTRAGEGGVPELLITVGTTGDESEKYAWRALF